MRFLFCCVLLALSLPTSAEEKSFLNPINPSADPWMGFADGRYRLATTQGDCIRLWSAPTIAGLMEAKPVILWQKGVGVWAPEFHFLRGPHGSRWFCYFTKTDGADVRHRMFVMESRGINIEGPYGPPKQLQTDPKDEFYAIDGTVFVNGQDLYFLWAGHPGHRLFISRMKDPLTLAGERTLIPASGFGCEEVREGPYVLRHGKRLFLTYSACDTGKPDYKVGYLWTTDDQNLTKPASWHQGEIPLLQRADQNGVFGPGHHSFFKSPDGREDWISYHAKTTSAYTYAGRSTRAQRLEWADDGFPKPVVPPSLTTPVPLPSGDRGR